MFSISSACSVPSLGPGESYSQSTAGCFYELADYTKKRSSPLQLTANDIIRIQRALSVKIHIDLNSLMDHTDNS